MFSTNTPLSLTISIHRALMAVKSRSKFLYRTSYILFGTHLTCNQIKHSTLITIKRMVDTERFLFNRTFKNRTRFNKFTNLTPNHSTTKHSFVGLNLWFYFSFNQKTLIFLDRLKLTMGGSGNILSNKGEHSTNTCNSLRMREIFNREGR